MVTHITSERLARASVAAGFAMAEALPEDSGRSPAEGAARRTWHALEHYLARYLAWTPTRQTGVGAWQQ